MGRLNAAVLAATLVAAAAAAPVLAKDVADFAITPGSADALVVFKAPDIPRPPGYKTSWRMGVQSYDPAEEKLQGAPFGGMETLAGRPKSFVDGYLVEVMKPGTYVFRDFSRQDLWSLCFNGGSLRFTIKPGEVLYLGEFDAAKHVEELQTLAVSSGRVTAKSGSPVGFFDTVSPPAFAPVDEAGLAAAAAMIKARMPKTTVAPKAARFAPARFGTGRDLFGLQRICGGYYTKKAKPRG
ncbi:MAG TPA: hypothetical protein VD846_12730 [Allosphingosinicella sp.]|nr:hypothetical protein [Allosphingosinicella sp.]